MGDLFDEFMRELERRRAQAEGRLPEDDANEPAGEGEGPPDDHEEPEPSEADDGDDAAHDDADSTDEAGDAGGPAEPTPIGTSRRRRRRRAGTPPPGGPSRRPVGGPDDGAGPPSFGSIMRRAGLVIGIVAIVALLVLAAAGIDLWTDAIWFRSVGFDSVFWTRIGAQVGLFIAAGVVALIVLLGNLLIANRLVPPPDPERPGQLRAVAGRLAEAQRQAERNARQRATGSFGAFGTPGGRPSTGGMTLTFDGDEVPDLVPIGTWVIAGFAVLLALGVAGAVSGAWETLLLWVNRVPYSTTSTVTDPVFNKDIGFFLFELPFYRFVQSLANGLLLASLAVAGARYLLAVTRGGEVFVTRVRVHLAVLGGLYLISVAFGYQLDKYELVYSNAGVATGVAFADANARFLAYDVLTFLSGIAGALLIAGAFTRWMWPLGAVLIIWFSASIVLGRLYPEAIQRLSVDPNTYAQEQPYIANNIAMTRLAFGLDQWDALNYGGEQPLTREAIVNEADTFTNARLWACRRCRRPSTSSRRCASTTTSTTSTRTATSSTARCAR